MDSSVYASYLVATIVALLVVSALAAVVLVGARKLGVARREGSVKLLGHLALDPRHDVYVVGVGERAFVLGTSMGTVTRLGEMARAEVPASHAPGDGRAARGRFVDVLARLGTTRPPAPPPLPGSPPGATDAT